MYNRQPYKDYKKLNLESIPDPVGTIKYDGANFWMKVESDGSLKFFSRRPSVKGHFLERSEKLPQLVDTKIPQYAGGVYNVELIHSGHSKDNKESHPAVSGILNSLPERAIATQKTTGPVRAVLFDVVSPKLATYSDKLTHLKEVEKALGKPHLIFAPKVKIGLDNINKLAEDTLTKGHEGIIVTSLTSPETDNPRLKIKHVNTYNLKVIGITQEFDILGNPKDSAGALELSDASGRHVGNVGTGFSRELRQEIYRNPKNWLDQLVQVKAMPTTATKLRSAVYNGIADGDLDYIK